MSAHVTGLGHDLEMRVELSHGTIFLHVHTQAHAHAHAHTLADTDRHTMKFHFSFHTVVTVLHLQANIRVMQLHFEKMVALLALATDNTMQSRTMQSQFTQVVVLLSPRDKAAQGARKSTGFEY